MKRATYVLIAVVSLAGAIVWWLGGGDAALELARSSGADAPATPQVANRNDPPEPRLDAAGQAEPDPPAPPALPDVRAQFWASKDYWALAEGIHEAAKRGDGASQYYLSVALGTCDFLYRYYFMEQRPGARPRIRTLDEAQQLTVTRQGSAYSPDDVRDIQSRCERIMTTTPPPFGTAAEWLGAAVASGYTLAQVNAHFTKAARGWNSQDPEKTRVARADARALAFDALQSKDAEVFVALGSTAFILGPDAVEAHKREWTWLMAAYLIEPNNPSQVEWTKVHCTFESQCHPDDTIIDVIRRDAGNDFDEIERRARELNEKIDAGTLEESDI